jgi:hypothetical protein
MMKPLFVLIMAASAAFSQYKVEPGGAPPSGLPPAIGAVLSKEGLKVTNGGAPYMEVWLTAKAPSGPKSTEDAVTLPMIPQGALVGVIRFPVAGKDRRGNTVRPGLYTMRYSQFPQNGDHQGVAPQRDFFLLSPAADDTNAAATPGFEELVAMSRKASGLPHPSVFSVSSSSNTTLPEIKKGVDTEADWVLHAKLGDTPIGLIIVGIMEH